MFTDVERLIINDICNGWLKIDMSREWGKEVDILPITNKRYLPIGVAIHTIFPSHVEKIVLMSKVNIK